MIEQVQTAGRSEPPRYTIGTLVNDRAQYADMLASFHANGFTDADCEFLPAFDPASAYSALNAILAAARGRFVILCHQDIRLLDDGRDALDQRLADLEASHPAWAVAGNAGGMAPGELAMRISDPHGENRSLGPLPARVMSLDENFLIVKAAARVGFSRDLAGFHLYGADICMAADTMGYEAHVIDFHLRHLSGGRKDASFQRAEAAFRAKWARALRPRWMQTTCTLLRLGASPHDLWLGRYLERPYRSLLRRTARGSHAAAAQSPATARR